MRSPLIFFLGVLWTVLAGFNALSAVSQVNLERDRLTMSTSLTSTHAWVSRASGDMVSFEALVGEDNPRVVHDLVVACREHRSRSATWEVDTRELPSIQVRLGERSVRVALNGACPRGDDRMVKEATRWRWRGVEPGMLLQALSTNPEEMLCGCSDVGPVHLPRGPDPHSGC